MALDWALLGSLRSRDNWQEIKQEKNNELRYQGVLNKMQEDDNASNEQKQAAIAEYLQTANKLEVLPNGMERIKAINEPLQATIAENIKKYGGDLDKYWKVQGQVDMQNYLQQLLHHPTTTRELMNASAAARWQADKQAGRQEKGQVDPATGQLINPFETQLHEYNAGNIDALNYSGAFDRSAFDPTVFTKFYGDPKNPHKVVPVSVPTFRDYAYNQFKQKGLDDQSAQQNADMETAQYAQAIKTKGFQPYTFKHDVPPRPATSWGNDQNAYISARANLDQWDAVQDPNYQGWSKPVQAKIYRDVMDKDGKMIKRGNAELVPMQTADMIPVPLGKKTITYTKKVDKYNANGKLAGAERQTVTEPVDDAIEAPIKIDGKLYFQTTADRLQGKMPQPLESKTFNKVLMSLKNTPDGLRVAAAYRKAAHDKNVLNPDGTLNFDRNNQQPQQPEQPELPTATRQEWIDNGWTDEQIEQAKSSGKISVDGE